MLGPLALVRLAGLLCLCSQTSQHLKLPAVSLPAGIALPVVVDHLLCAALGLGCRGQGHLLLSRGPHVSRSFPLDASFHSLSTIYPYPTPRQNSKIQRS